MFGEVDSQPKHLMVIDDSRTIRLLIESALAREHLIRDGERYPRYIVNDFATGTEAIRALRQQLVPVPALAFIDISMPEMDGYTVTRLFKQQPGMSDVKIVMISGLTGVIDRMRSRLAGADAFITKPFKPGEIIAKVRQMLESESGVLG